jgi:hypothetical protein
MRALATIGLGFGLLGACSNDVDPRVINGGGVGDGEIDGEVNVYVIDSRTDEPVAGATVSIGETNKTTDAKGLVTFGDVEGEQTIAAKASNYRSSVWAHVNGANITIPIQPLTGTPEQATLAGTIAGWSTINVAAGHAKAAFITYSQSDDLGDDANNLMTPNNTNICIGADCNWSVVTRTGPVTLIAIIVDRDLKGTPAMFDDDTNEVIGYAFKTGVTVNGGISQSGLVLDQVEAGNLETLTYDLGTPPAGLPETLALPGIEVSSDEVIQLPLFVLTDATSLLVPKPTVFSGSATYRLTAVAQTTSGALGAQSIVLRQGQTTPTLEAGEWLVPPVNVEVTRTTASWDLVSGAALHTVIWRDATHELLEISVFDSKTHEVEVPNAVALPTSGTLTAKVQGIGADFDANDFSLEDDSELLWGISAQPVMIP